MPYIQNIGGSPELGERTLASTLNNPNPGTAHELHRLPDAPVSRPVCAEMPEYRSDPYHY